MKTQIAVCFVSREGRYLLLHRSPTDSSNPNRWGLAGGHVEVGETPIQGAIRELHEETALKTKPKFMELLQVIPLHDKDLYLYHVTRSKGDVKLLDGEHHEFVWCPPEAVGWYDCLPYMQETIEQLSKKEVQ
jgi:8-oxo-dGTP diphosphatase